MALRSKAASKTEYNSRPFTKSNLAGRSFCLGVMPIPCPHFKITIVKRSQGQSAVAGAAYQSGERLFSEYDQKTKFYNKKKELVHAEIMLPSHAPPGFADRQILWSAVEAVENQWNSQLARRIVLAFPVEAPKEQYLSMISPHRQPIFGGGYGRITAGPCIRNGCDFWRRRKTSGSCAAGNQRKQGHGPPRAATYGKCGKGRPFRTACR